MQRVRCVLMRGGTSKAVFVKETDLPAEPAVRDRMILALFGTPDKRQIDGLGGANAPTSKLAIIGPPSVAGADVDYTFVQVGVERATLDYNGNCGNISAAVGPYAIQEGFVRATAPTTRVRIHNTNTKKILLAEVPVVDGEPAVEGDCEVPGVPGTGARIYLDYSRTMGTQNGKFFPTGNVVDRFDDPAGGTIAATLADVANPIVYVKATDLGLEGTASMEAFAAAPALRARLEALRAQAAVRFGMTDDPAKALLECSMFPLITVVHGPATYPAYGSDETLRAEDMDVIVRMMVLQHLHPTFAGTGTANLGAAALVPGTVVHDVLSQRAKDEGVVRFAHPMGITRVEAEVELSRTGEWTVIRAAYDRTARRLMEGYAYVRTSLLADAAHAAGLRGSVSAVPPDFEVAARS